MKYNWIIALSIPYLLAGCNAVNEIKLQTKTYTAIEAESIPFRYKKKLIVVDAFLNTSKTPNRFIFDTGAFQSKIEYNLAKELGLKTLSTRENGTAQGIKREMEITMLDSIKFSKSMFGNIAAGKLQYDPKSYSPCVAEDGIIGSNLIKLAHWKFDYQKQHMYVSDIPFTSNAAHPIRMEFKTSFMSGVPLITIEIDGKTIEDVIFDLGFNGGLVVPKEHAPLFHSNKSQKLIDQSTSGIFGSKRDTLVVKELNVRLGDFETNIPVEFSSLNKALLGNDFLEHFTVYLNNDDDSIILEPISKVALDKTRPFIPGILNDSLWVVNRTSPKSPLQIGDTLLRVNGHTPRELYDTHCDYFLNTSNLLAADTLSIETIKGDIIKLNLN